MKAIISNIFRKKTAAIKSKYDAAEPNDQRRQPNVERGDENAIFPQHKRLKGAAIGRDLERNFSQFANFMQQFRVNVVGSDGKIRINTEGSEALTDWFNGWIKDCDYRGDQGHWNVQLGNLVTSIMRDGDVVVAFDDNLFEDSGKLIYWETDQIAALSEDAFEKSGLAGENVQDNGIVRDKKTGKVVAYVVSAKHGVKTIDNLDEALILPATEARILKQPWRLNQGRGTARALTCASQVQDVYEILAAELFSAKKASSTVGVVTEDEETQEGIEYAELSDEEAAEADEAGTVPDNYDRLEAFTGGYTEYLKKGDKFELLSTDRPNIHLPEFIDDVVGMSGAALGLARCYATMKAQTSYTAYRGEMIMTWATFYWWQKWLEREFCDWVAVKAITWAGRTGKIAGTLPDGWERSISWSWPKMPEVDSLKAANADRANLKNGKINFEDLIGPDWDKKLSSYRGQLNKYSDLPLSAFETVSGSVIEDDSEKTDGDDDEK